MSQFNYALFSIAALAFASACGSSQSVSKAASDQIHSEPEISNVLPISEELFLKSQESLEYKGTNEVCADRIARATYESMNNFFKYDAAGIETVNIVSIQLIEGNGLFDNVQAFRVSASDETDPSAWLVVVEAEDCVIEFITIGEDSSF